MALNADDAISPGLLFALVWSARLSDDPPGCRWLLAPRMDLICPCIGRPKPVSPCVCADFPSVGLDSCVVVDGGGGIEGAADDNDGGGDC